MDNTLNSDWFVAVHEILAEEPEEWLSYLYGQQSLNIPASKSAIKKRGWLLGSLNLWASIFKNSSFSCSSCLEQSDFLVFASTQNQASALSSTVQYLRDSGVNVDAVTMNAELSQGRHGHGYHRLKFCRRDLRRTAHLFLVNAPRLYARLKALPDKNAIFNFDSFCITYVYLVSFYRILSARRPRFVVVSNDHNPENRCLLAIANYLKIETVYLQHASVTRLFPALNVSYAFLDGAYSLEMYRACKKNRPPNRSVQANPIVFLTGQKKDLNCKNKAKNTHVGIAVNSLDDPDATAELVRCLLEGGIEVTLRWHPNQNLSHVSYFKAQFESMARVRLSDPGLEDVATFLCGVRCVVAGNSSIHLEAALLGVVPVYYEEKNCRISDYYGFVANGLAIGVNSKRELLNLVSDLDSVDWSNESAVKYYSATFNTEWEGREGELVARLLLTRANERNGERWDSELGSISFGPYRLGDG